jgi:hypothetical protein
VIYFFKILFGELIKIYHAKILGYYTSVDKISIYRWDKIENGEYQYLFKKKIGKVPEYFKLIITDMFYQFDNVNMSMINKQLNLAYLRSLYVTTKRSDFLNKARSLEAEILKELDIKIKGLPLNKQINFVETIFNSIGSIDKHKMDASRFKSLLNAAVEKLDQLNKSHGNN